MQLTPEYCDSLVRNLLMGWFGVCVWEGKGDKGDIAAIEDSNTKHCCRTTGFQHTHKYKSALG